MYIIQKKIVNIRRFPRVNEQFDVETHCFPFGTWSDHGGIKPHPLATNDSPERSGRWMCQRGWHSSASARAQSASPGAMMFVGNSSLFSSLQIMKKKQYIELSNYPGKNMVGKTDVGYIQKKLVDWTSSIVDAGREDARQQQQYPYISMAVGWWKPHILVLLDCFIYSNSQYILHIW